MSRSTTRSSMQQVQLRFLLVAVISLIFGCVIGAGVVGLYIWTNPPVYSGGAYPNELTPNYQDHYLAMVIDSYIVNGQAEVAAERLKTFDAATQIRALGQAKEISESLTQQWNTNNSLDYLYKTCYVCYI